MKRKTSRILAGVIAGIMALLMIVGLFSELFTIQAQALTTSQSNLNKLRESLSGSSAKKKELQAQLDKLSRDKSNVLKQIDVLDQKVEAMEEEIDLHTKIAAQLAQLISEKEKQVAESQEKEDTQYDKLKARVRVMYESGDTSYLGILLESNDFFDFLSRYEIVNQISQYEKKLFEEIKKIKEGQMEQKAELEANRAEEIEVKAELQQNKKTLDKQMSDRQVMMNQIEAGEQEHKEDLVAIAKEEERLNDEIKKMAAELSKNNNSSYVGGEFAWPIPGHKRVSSSFGMRFHPVLQYNKLHTGTDIGAPTGTKINAMNGGKVIKSTYSSALGNYIMIDHGGGKVTLYAHMSKRLVSQGATVTKSQNIGLVGSTGYSTGPHLHFEVIVNGEYTNPMSYFK